MLFSSNDDIDDDEKALPPFPDAPPFFPSPPVALPCSPAQVYPPPRPLFSLPPAPPHLFCPGPVNRK